MTDSYSHNESDLCDLEQILRSLIEKHSLLERKLKETQLKTQEITLAKLEIERILANETRELADTKAQLKLMQSTLQQWEQDRSNQREKSVKQWIQVESLTNERNVLVENLKKLQVENMKMKITMEETERRELDQKNFEHLTLSSKASMNSIFENIFEQCRKLELEQSALKKNFIIAKNVGERMVQLLKQHHGALNEAYAENNRIKEAYTSLSSEINLRKESDAYHSDLKTDARIENVLEKHLNRCKSSMKSLTERLSKEVDEKAKLNELLKKTLQEQDKFCKREQEMQCRFSELEKTIESYQETQDERLPMTSVWIQTDP